MRGRSLLQVPLLLLLVLGLLAPPAAAQVQGSVLVFSKTAGFRHDSIPAGIAMIQSLGADNDFDVDATEDAAQFTEENLADYDAVVWLSTTGDVLNDEQQAAFEAYIQGGGGYVGIHAASDTEYGWDWYGDLVGAYFESHPPGTPGATVEVEDTVHPSTAHLPLLWDRVDEWYNYQTNPRGTAHVLASMDEDSYDEQDGSALADDHPIAWCKDYDGGRSWYTGMGHTAASFSEDAFEEHVLGGIQTAAGWVDADCGGTVWENYEVVKLGEGGPQFGEPIDMAVLPDSRVLYTTRQGQFHLVDPNTGANTVIATLPVYQHDEDGLQGIELSPNFAEDGWLYVFYAPPLDTPSGDAPANGTDAQFEAFEGANYVSRFQLDLEANSIDLDSEEIVLEIPTDRGRCCHVGGDLVFGEDGNLYVSTGDDTDPFSSGGYAPIDDREGRSPAFDARRSSGNTNDLRGKILRITPNADGPGYTVPEGNLFEDDSDLTRPEIFVMGLRNPFRIEFDPATGAVMWGEYGPDAGGASASQGPKGYVEWSMTTQPENHGWPYCIADNKPYEDYDFATETSSGPFDCAAATNDSRHNTGLETLPPAQPADIWYGDSPTEQPWPELGSGGQSPMGGPIYRYDEDLASAVKFPEYFDGKAFLYEWSRDWVKTLTLGSAEGDVTAINDFLPNAAAGVTPPLWDNPMDMEFGPDGNLFVLNYGDGYFGAFPDAGLYRVDYTSGTRAPVAAVSASVTSGQAPLAVEFTAEGSRDPEGGELTYEWDLDGDGEIDATGPTASTTYTENGQYAASVRVTSTSGLTDAASLTITVGNTAPVVELTFPQDGGFFSFGDEVAYEVTVTDPDGEVDCADVTVSYALGHNNHAHPLSDSTGCTGTISTPRDEGHPATEQLYGVFGATYTDDGGDGVPPLTGTDNAILNPKLLQAEHYDEMSGVQVVAAEGAEGGSRVGYAEAGDWIAFSPANLAGITGVQVRGTAGGEGGTVELRWDAPDGPVLGTIEITSTGDWETYGNFGPTELSDVPAESGTLYAVWQGAADIDSFTFLGVGVAEQAAPQVSASAEPASGQAPLEVAFDGTAFDAEGGDLTYAWDFGDGGTADTLDATHTYAEAGTYTAVLTVTDDQGLEGMAEVTVEVAAEPVDPPACLGARSDEFDGDSLDTDRWSTIVRENPDLYSVSDGQLVMDLGAGDMYGAANSAENLLLQPAPQGEWTVTTQLSMTGVDQWQQAGLMVYADDENYAKAGIVGVGANQKLEFLWENNGTVRNEGAADGIEPLPEDFPDVFQLQVRSDGSDVTAHYSTDGGATWTQIGRSAPIGANHGLQVGMFAFRALEESPAQTATFDFFHLTPDDTATAPTVSDEFGGDSLNACRWNRIVREDPDGYEVADGGLTIQVPDGDIYTGNTDPLPTNFVLQDAPEGDWTVETHISEQSLQGWYQQGGLLVHVDDDNYVKFDVIADEGSTTGVNRIELRSEVGGTIQDPTPQVTDALPDNPDGSWWLRLTKTGNSYSGEFSADGETWTSVGAAVPNAALAEGAAVGVFTLGASQQEAASVTFDYFRLVGEEQPGEGPEPCPAFSDSFDGDSLDTDLWSAIVREDADGYTVADGDLTMPTTATDIYGENNGDTPNIILQPLPDGAWEATVQLTAEVYDAYQQAGLIVYGDDDNYAKMVLEGRTDNATDPAARVFQLLREDAATPTEWNTDALGADYPDTVWVRFTSDGSELTASYSADGETYTDMGQTLSLTGISDPRIGLVALAGSGQPVTDAVFHEFVLATEDCPTEDTTPPTVTADVSGDGTDAVTLTLDAEDDQSDIAEVHYRMAGEEDFEQYTEPVVFTEPGEYEVEFRAADTAGNASDWQSVSFTVSEPVPVPDPCPALSDTFDGDSLDTDLWSAIVREDADGYTVADGNLTLPTTATDIYGTNNTDTPNIILQPLPDGAWQATAQLTLEAYEAYQQAGLIVYGDDDDYGKIVLQGRDTAQANPAARVFQFIREEAGVPNEVGDSNTAQLGADYPDTVWVRLASDGSNLTASYSADGETFTAMPQTKSLAGIENPRIGLVALAGGGQPVTDAVFHEFVLATADCPDPDPEDTTAPTVDAEVEGDGTEEVTLTLTADDGEGGSGVAEVHYRMAGDTEFMQYDGPVTFTEPGSYTVEFRAADTAGNASDWDSVSFTVAEPAPVDACPDGASPDDSVVFGDEDSGVPNYDSGDGCTILDLVNTDTNNRSAFLRSVMDVAGTLYDEGIIDRYERADLIRAASRSDVGRPERPARGGRGR